MNNEKLLEMAEALVKAQVITTNPYSGKDAGKPMIYRMRLFTESERATLRRGLRLPGSGWECIPGGAGLSEELAMVQFEAHGRTLEDIKRTIGR